MADWKKNKYDKNIRILDAGNGWLVDDTNDAQITVNPIYVGTITNGGAYPSVRPDGSALADGDYVKVDPSATLPFTLGNVTFNTVNDQAVWDENAQEWKYDPSSSRETAGVEVSDPNGEDYPKPDGVLASVQQDINMHFRYWIDWLVEAIKQAGYSFDLTATDVDSNRSLKYQLIDKEGRIIKEETWDNFLLNSRMVSGIDLTDDITSQELEESLKDIVVTYTGKTMDADDNTFINFRVGNFNVDAITDSTEIATTSNWTDLQIPTTKAVMDYTGSDIDAVYDDGSTSVENPFITLYLRNATGATIDWCKVNIENGIVDIDYVENGTTQDNELDVTFENGFQVQIPLTNVVITDHVQALTNKTIDADNNTITNLEVDNFKINTPGSTTAGVIVTEINDAEDDTMLPTAKAVYDYSTYGIDSHVDVTNNQITIDLEDKNGVDRDTTTIPLQELEYDIADDSTNELTLSLTDGTDSFTEVTFEIPSDIEWVDALPVGSDVRTDRLYSVRNESPSALRWWDGTAWYDLADTNGIVTVAALPPVASARQDCLYNINGSDDLYWYDGTRFTTLACEEDLITEIDGAYYGATTKIVVQLKKADGTIASQEQITIDNMVKSVEQDATTNTVTVTHIDDTTDTLDVSPTLTGVDGITIDNTINHTVGHTNQVTGDSTESIRSFAYDDYGHLTTETSKNLGRGLDDQSDIIGHSNSVTGDSTESIRSFAYDDYGHLTTETSKTLGRGISDSSNEIGHSNSVTAVTSSDGQIYNYQYDDYGHITGRTVLSSSVLANRGLNVDTNGYVGHSNSITAASTSGNRAVCPTYDSYGHITAITYKDKMYGCDWGSSYWKDAYVNANNTTYSKKVQAGTGISITSTASGNDRVYSINNTKTPTSLYRYRFNGLIYCGIAVRIVFDFVTNSKSQSFTEYASSSSVASTDGTNFAKFIYASGATSFANGICCHAQYTNEWEDTPGVLYATGTSSIANVFFVRNSAARGTTLDQTNTCTDVLVNVLKCTQIQ